MQHFGQSTAGGPEELLQTPASCSSSTPNHVTRQSRPEVQVCNFHLSLTSQLRSHRVLIITQSYNH